MPETREELIKQAQAKFNREQLIKQAQEKWMSENSEPVDSFSTGEKVSQTLRSGAEGLTFGLSEPVVSGINAAGQNIGKSAEESSSLGDFVRLATDPERLKKEYQVDVERRRQFEKEHPYMAAGGEITGALVPLAFTGGTSAIAKGANFLPNLLTKGGQLVEKGARIIPGAAKALDSAGVIGSAARIGTQAIAGGGTALAAEGLKRSVQEPAGFIRPEDKLPSLGEVAAFGAKFGGTLASIPEIASQSARFGKMAARVLTGVRARDIDYYLANQKAVQEAPSLIDIKNQIDDTILKLNDDVSNAKLSVDQAKSVLRQNEERLAEAVKQNKNITGQQKFELRQALKQAEKEFQAAWKDKLTEIKTARVPIHTDDVLDSVEAVKQQVSDLSEQSYAILDAYPEKFDISGVSKEINKIQKGLKVDGKLMSKDSEAAFNSLERWKQNLSGMGFVSGPKVKKIIQEIDSDLRSAGDRLAGEFSDGTYTALMGLRKTLDSKIKDAVPQYQEIMQDVAAMNVLRGEMVKAFGRRENVVSKLARIDNPKLSYERNLLSQMGKISGKDFDTPVAEFIATKGQGATPIAQEKAMQSLPEFQALQKARRAEGATRAPGYGQAQAQFIAEKGPEAQAVKSAMKLVEDSTKALNEAKAALGPYKNLKPGQTEGFIKELIGNPRNGIEKRKLAKSLSEMSETDFLSMVDALRTKEAFDRTITQGSRNVNFWGALGAVIGFLSGGFELVPSLGGAGIILGQITDQYGPAMTRKVLDGMLKIKNNPTVKDVSDAFASVPPDVRDRLKTDLLRITTTYNNSSAIDRRMSDIEKR